jgi:hypothetical protein
MASRKQMRGILMLLFGLILAGCLTDNSGSELHTGPKTIVITGFNLNVTKGIECVIRWELDGPAIARLYRGIQGFPGSVVSMELIDMDTTTASGTHPENGEQPWTGTGNYFISFNPDNVNYFYSADGTNIKRFYINDAVTTLDWAKFVQR